MKNDKSIETKLRSAVSHAVPDALDDILSACDHEKGKVIYMEKKRTSPLRSDSRGACAYSCRRICNENLRRQLGRHSGSCRIP